MVVEKGDKIFVPTNQLTSTEITVQWNQNLSSKSQQYYSVPFFNKDKGNDSRHEAKTAPLAFNFTDDTVPSQGDEQSILFIQKDYVDSFKGKKTGGDDFTVIVDDSFQYGQNQQKTQRWLAYHDKSMKAYQVSFCSSLNSCFNLTYISGDLLQA